MRINHVRVTRVAVLVSTLVECQGSEKLLSPRSSSTARSVTVGATKPFSPSFPPGMHMGVSSSAYLPPSSSLLLNCVAEIHFRSMRALIPARGLTAEEVDGRLRLVLSCPTRPAGRRVRALSVTSFDLHHTHQLVAKLVDYVGSPSSLWSCVSRFTLETRHVEAKL